MHGLRVSIPGVSTLTQVTATDDSPVEVRTVRLGSFRRQSIETGVVSDSDDTSTDPTPGESEWLRRTRCRQALKWSRQAADITDMAHKQPRARRDYPKSMIWAGLGLSGLSTTALALVLGYSALTNLFTSGPSDSITGSVPILAISTGVGLATSILAFIIEATTEMRSISGVQENHRSLAGASSGIPHRDPTL